MVRDKSVRSAPSVENEFQHFNADFFNPALKSSPLYTEYRKRQEKAQSTFTNNSSTSKFANSRESLY